MVFAEELLSSFGLERVRARTIAFFAALAWAVHPVQSAAVVYISGRADPLAATFGFLGLFFLIRANQAGGSRKLFLFAASVVALLLSAFSKEAGLIFPLIGIILFVLQKNLRELWRLALVTAFVGTIYFALRLGAEHQPAPELTPPPPVLVRPIIIARAVAEYAGLIVFPWNLHMDRDVETQPTGFSEASLAHSAWRELQTLLGIVLIAGYFYWMWRSRKRSPVVFACLLFGLITYLPVSGIIALNATAAEHWIYLPTAFLFLAIALECTSILRIGSSSKPDSCYRDRRILRLVRVSGLPHLRADFRLERSADVSRTDDCERGRFGTNADQSRRLGIERGKTPGGGNAFAHCVAKEARSAAGGDQPGGGGVETKRLQTGARAVNSGDPDACG